MKGILIPTVPETVTYWKVEVSGVVVGKMKFSADGEYYHVLLDAAPSEGGGLYQGHGKTPELAIQEMLDRHEKYATNQLSRIKELRGLLL